MYNVFSVSLYKQGANMKFDSYEQYVEEATKFYSNNQNIKIPYTLMILSERMFKEFNGNINFGPGYKKCSDCTNEKCCKK